MPSPGGARFPACAGRTRTSSPVSFWGAAQKLLDRILFIAFCEDRGLLPPETIKRAFSYRDPYNPRPLWDNFRGMFRSVNIGNPDLNIHKYNGGLFADDPVLDGLKIPDEVFGLFRDLAEYDFRPPSVVADTEVVSDSRLIDVEILGPHLRTVDQRPGEAPGRAGQARRSRRITRGRGSQAKGQSRASNVGFL